MSRWLKISSIWPNCIRGISIPSLHWVSVPPKSLYSNGNITIVSDVTTFYKCQLNAPNGEVSTKKFTTLCLWTLVLLSKWIKTFFSVTPTFQELHVTFYFEKHFWKFSVFTLKMSFMHSCLTHEKSNSVLLITSECFTYVECSYV